MSEEIKYDYGKEVVRVLNPDGEVVVLEKGVGVARQPMEFIRKPRKKVKKPYIKKKDRIENLTEKQKKFVANVAKGMPFNRAAMDAYNPKSLNTASGIANSNLNNPTIKELVLKVLDRKGINLETALEPLVKSLKAKKNIVVDGEMLTTDVDDLDLQLKASDRALKLMGVSYKEQESSGGNNYIQINNIHKEEYND